MSANPSVAWPGGLIERPEVAFARKVISRMRASAMPPGSPDFKNGVAQGTQRAISVIKQVAGIDMSKSGGLAQRIHGDEILGGALDGNWWKYALAAAVGLGAGYYAKKKRYF